MPNLSTLYDHILLSSTHTASLDCGLESHQCKAAPQLQVLFDISQRKSKTSIPQEGNRKQVRY